MKGLAFSWTVSTCLFKLIFWPNNLLQIKHVNCLIFSWTVSTWIFKYFFSPNNLLQIKQVNCFLFSWTVLTCWFNFPFWPNFWWQMRHSIFSSLLWTILMCNCTVDLFVQVLGQINTQDISVTKGTVGSPFLVLFQYCFLESDTIFQMLMYSS